MLLQFPVFIALYRVFGQSIDLYQAPFALWIHDLSLKDPYYVLPVIMAVAFFFQTKLTPSTMDPASPPDGSLRDDNPKRFAPPANASGGAGACAYTPHAAHPSTGSG